ncbi:uroporphyrinogen-III synthase [Albimonas sp. CAU 1670]|uniref:uroporphyrinogen-III synthase n=1 Tax=Albimonas sp. CAU 1670 TaxID=3032599 RepID=UPI0023DC08C3|nr:uroporphyrinogen-III synthase [Albimonas sp. CAU 1670]MDF2234682.1 uroporphyrinogen-III synthase [Albimonas sp. CAU 1670]
MSAAGAPEAEAPAGAAPEAPVAPLALVTRPEPAAARLAAALEAEGWRTLSAPLMRFETLPAPADPAGAWAIALTSASGARAAPAGEALRAPPCFCVGEATAEAARAAGFADVRAADGDAAALAELIAAQAPQGAEILHLRGRHGGEDLAEALAARGLRLRQAVVYAMSAAEALPPEADAALAAGEVKMIPVFSPRSGAILARLLSRRHDLSRTVAVAISRAAAEGLDACGFARVEIAAAPTRKAMRAAMGDVAKAARRRAARSAPDGAQDPAPSGAQDTGREA